MVLSSLNTVYHGVIFPGKCLVQSRYDACLIFFPQLMQFLFNIPHLVQPSSQHLNNKDSVLSVSILIPIHVYNCSELSHKKKFPHKNPNIIFMAWKYLTGFVYGVLLCHTSHLYDTVTRLCRSHKVTGTNFFKLGSSSELLDTQPLV